ncbi:hypothetical protein D3C80_1309330 [compost metagenome]
MGEIFDRLGQQELVQPFERVVGGPASDAGKVVDFPAHATHTAGLLDDAGLLHAAQELHPLHRQDAGVGALAEHKEHMFLQRADGANRRPFRPSLALDCVPLAGQMLEGVVGRFELRCLLGTLGRHDAAILRGAVTQLADFAAGLFAGQLVGAVTIAAESQPRPFAVRFLVTQLPGL